MKNIVKLANLAVAAAFLLCTTSALAQEDPPGNLVEMWTFHADADAVGAFEEAFKEHLALRKENEDPFNWQTFVKNTGDVGTEYYVRACCFGWEDRDAYDAWEAEHPQINEHWNSSVHPHIAGYEHDFEEMDFENSHWPEDSEPAKFVGVTSYRIAPGGWQAMDAAREKMSQVGINEGWASAGHRWAWASSVNGHPGIALVIPFTNYADMAAPDPNFYQFLSNAVGEDEAQALFEQFTSGTKGSHYEIYTHRPDLSTTE